MHRTQLRRTVVFALPTTVLLTVFGCAGLAEKNVALTGETRVFQADLDYDVFPIAGYGELHLAHDVGLNDLTTDFDLEEYWSKTETEYFYALPNQGQPTQNITIMMNRAYLKYLEEIGKPEVLAYVEVQQGEEPPVRRIFFRDDFQPSGTLFNFQDSVIYGPAPYKGKKINIKFYVYELDGDDNKVLAAVIKALADTAKLVTTPLGLAAQTGSDLIGNSMQALINTNVDDREFFHELTMWPIRPGSSRPLENATTLRTGPFVLVKKEVQRNVDVEALVDFTDEQAFECEFEGDFTPPNIVLRSGELFQHREMEKQFYSKLRSLAENPLQAEVDKYIRAETTYRKNPDKPKPDSAELNRSLRQIVDQVFERSDIGFRTEAIKPEEDGDVVAENARVVIENYVPYRAKSYLTFSVLSHMPPEDGKLLEAVYTDHAKQIEDELNAEVDADEIAKNVLELQLQLGKALVALVTEKKLKGINDPAKIKEVRDQLKEIYPDEYDGAVDEAADALLANRKLVELTSPKQTDVKARLKRILPAALVNEIVKGDEADWQEILEVIGKFDPDLLPIVQGAIDDLTTLEQLTDVFSP